MQALLQEGRGLVDLTFERYRTDLDCFTSFGIVNAELVGLRSVLAYFPLDTLDGPSVTDRLDLRPGRVMGGITYDCVQNWGRDARRGKYD